MGILVLHPQVIRSEPNSVVGSVANDPRNIGTAINWIGKALLLHIVKTNRRLTAIGDNKVIAAVAIKINKP
jgi:hypothetical protein